MSSSRNPKSALGGPWGGFWRGSALRGPGAPQERAGVKMILIQDGSQNTNVDKPLRIIGEPYKVQVRRRPQIPPRNDPRLT